MLNYKITKTVLLLVLLAATDASSCRAAVREQSQAFFKTFCVSCHGQDAPEAGLRLDTLDAQRWEDI